MLSYDGSEGDSYQLGSIRWSPYSKKLVAYDGVTGEVKNRITQGEWVVRAVNSVDEWPTAGRDGVTDIWGVIVGPTNFDPSREYPVIENIYAGPQGSFVPKSWSPISNMLSMAELGFIVVQINVVNAHRLTGRLLLAVGEHDTNVDPSSTMQLVKALIDADKRFDFSIQPGRGHGVGGQFRQRRDDFFVKWLLGVEPPDWNSGVTLGIDETTGEPLDYPDFSLEPPAGFFEQEDEVAPGAWW